MSGRSSHEHVPGAESSEVLEIIREEQGSRCPSSVNINDDKKDEKSLKSAYCPCQAAEAEKRHEEEKEKILKEKELEMEAKYKEKLDSEIQYLKDRFGFILQNEQLRASYMLREAHRERQEKISALQTQLECKNLAGLMYVLCCEQNKSKMEKLRIIEEYTNYIQALQSILEDSQTLILNLSRGYKTAARVDEEWREKTKKIMQHFQSFVYDFVGGTPEANQYFFDIPTLLKTKTSIKDNPQEDPCEECEDCEECEQFTEPEKSWYEKLEGDNRPFVMFGDMSDLKTSQKGEVLRSTKAAKTAPRKWKEYVFHDMYLKQSCPNADIIKDMVEVQGHWEFTATDRQTSSRCSETPSRRVTTASVDMRGNMGSILKIITATGPHQNAAKTTLLGARDSMEIASTTRLREKHRPSSDHPKVVLNIGNRIDSLFNETPPKEEETVEPEPKDMPRPSKEDDVDDSWSNLASLHHDSLQLIQTHVPDHNSKINYEKKCPMEKCQRLQVDSFIRSLPAYMRASPFTHFEQNYDDYEPCSPEQLDILRSRIEEKKKREKVDFVAVNDPLKSWDPSVEGVGVSKAVSVGERVSAVMGIAMVQTSLDSLLPPCTCLTPSPSLASSTMKVYNDRGVKSGDGADHPALVENGRTIAVQTFHFNALLQKAWNVEILLPTGNTTAYALIKKAGSFSSQQVANLVPIKQEVDKINEKCFFDDGIQFERFKVIGQNESDDHMNYEKEKEFSRNRLHDLKKILKMHPSLCEIFQANTRC